MQVVSELLIRRSRTSGPSLSEIAGSEITSEPLKRSAGELLMKSSRPVLPPVYWTELWPVPDLAWMTSSMTSSRSNSGTGVVDKSPSFSKNGEEVPASESRSINVAAVVAKSPKLLKKDGGGAALSSMYIFVF